MSQKKLIHSLVNRVAGRLIGDSRTAFAFKEKESSKREVEIETLEPRVLFSGSPAPAPAPEAAPAAQEAPAPAPSPESEPAAGADAEVAAPPAATETTPAPATADEGVTAIALTDAEVSAVSEAAAGRWADSGLTADQAGALASVNYVITDLGGDYLGATEGNTVYIDDDAAGLGWFVDATPMADEEFGSDGFALAGGDGGSTTGVDLLSVLLHEQGHILGLDGVEGDASQSGNVMFGQFDIAERRSPEAGQAEGAIALSLEGTHYAMLPYSGTNLTLWLRADNLDGLNLDPGVNFNRVIGWEDETGIGGNTVANDGTGPGGQRPLWQDNQVNGEPAIRFDNTSRNIIGSSFLSGGDARTIFVVAKSDSANNSILFDPNGQGGGATLFRMTPEVGVRFGNGTEQYGNALTGSYGIFAATLPAGGTNGDVEGFRDGPTSLTPTAAGNTNVVNTGTAGYKIGQANFKGNVAEVIAFNEVLSAIDFNAVGYYLGEKYGITHTFAAPVPTDVHWDNGSTDTNGTVTGPYQGTDLWNENVNWRVNSTPGTQGTAPNDVRPGLLDRANISLNDGENADVPARITTGDSIEVSSVRIGGNFGLGTGGDGILNVEQGGVLDVTGNGLGSGIELGYANRDGQLNVSGGGQVNVASGNLILGRDAGQANDNNGVTVTGATSQVDVAGAIRVANVNNSTGTFTLTDGTVTAGGGFSLAQAGGGSDGSVIIGDGATNPTLNVSGGNFETANEGTGVVTMNSGTFNQNDSNLIVGQGGSSNALFTMNGGLIDIENQMRFNDGTGVFNQTGGTVNVGTILDIGNLNGGQGTYTMTGGILNVGDRSASDLIIGNFNNASTSAKMEIIDGTVDVSRSIRIANTGANSSGTLIVGDGTTSPTITLNTGAGNNFETATVGTGTFTFKSGTITINNNNWITGQNGSSEANVEIGGFAAAATLNVDGGNGARDWNTNTGDGNVTVFSNGTVNVGRSMNLGNNGAQGGLVLDIDGGTVNVGTKVTGDVNFRNNGVRDEITLQDGGTFDVNRNFNMNQGAGILNVNGAGATFNIGNNYSQNGASTLSFTADASGVSTIDVTAAANLNGILSVDLTALSSVTDVGDIVLVDSATTAGTFSTVNLSGATFGDGSTYVLSYAYDAATGIDGGGNDVALVAVAETRAGLDGSGNLVVDDTQTPTDDNLTFTVVDAGAAIQINNSSAVLVAGAGMTQVDANTVKIDIADITGGTVIANGNGGDDTFTITNPNGTVIDLDFEINGGGETTGDTLNLEGAAGAGTAFTETYSVGPTNDAGTVVTTNGTVTQTITFTGLEPLNTTVEANFVVVATDGANTINVINGTGSRVRVEVDSFEAAEFENKTNVTINAGTATGSADMADTITVNYTNTPAMLDTLTINAGLGADIINVTDSAGPNLVINAHWDGGGGGSDADNITVTDAHGTSLFIGGNGGNDIISVIDTNVTGTTTISGDNGDDNITVDDANSAALTVNGGNQNDTISVTNAHSASLLIQGGNNNDTITLTQTETTGITTIRGNNGNDTIEIIDAMSSELIVDVGGTNGDGNDTITLRDTHTSGQTVLDSTNGGTGNNDTFIVDDAHSASLLLRGRGGSDSFTVNDTHTTGQTRILGDNGGDTATIGGSNGGSFRVELGNQNDTINIGGAAGSGDLGNIVTTIDAFGQGNTDILNINDEANASGRAIVIDGANTSISADGTEIVDFNGDSEDLNVSTGTGADSVTIDGALTIPRNLSISADDIIIDAPTVTATTGSQTYNGAVDIIGQDTTLTAANDVTFAGTVDSSTGQGLTVNADGTTGFLGDVGSSDALSSLTTDAGGTTVIGAASPVGALNYDAGDDDGANAIWENTGTAGGLNITALSGETFNGSPTTSLPGITGSYDFDGSGSGGNLGTLNGTGSPSDNQDVSFEMWFRPADLTGDEVLFETGGGTGVGIFLGGGSNGNLSGVADTDVLFSVTSNSLGNQTAFVAGDLSGIGVAEFIHVVGTFDIGSDTATFYINGQQVGTDVSSANITDWSGGDNAGVGRRGGSNMGGVGGGQQGFSNYDGEIAIFRVYDNTVLTASQVAVNYFAIAGTVINTTGDQTFNDGVTLNAETTINSDGGDVNFADTVDGANALNVDAGGGTATFFGTVGGGSALDTLTSSTDTDVVIANGVVITTEGDQTFNGGLEIGSGATITQTFGMSEFTTAADNGASPAAGSSPYGPADLFVRERNNENNPEWEVQAFIKFDLSTLPAGTVSGVTLQLHQFDKLNNNSAGLFISRALESWDASGSDPGFNDGANDGPGGATDVDGEFTFGNNGPGGAGTAKTFTITIPDAWVQGWIDDPSTNHGVRLKIARNFVASSFDTTGPDAPLLSVTMDPADPSALVGQATSTSNTAGDGLVLANTSTYTASIEGAATPGVDYDQIVVNGEVDLNDAELVIEMDPGYTPVGGDTIVLISNDGAEAVNGTFVGLAEGNIIAFERGGVANALFRISYTGGSTGDVNDVVLETADTNATTSIHLDGSGNLIIQDVDEGVVGGGTGNDEDTLTLFVDGMDLVIRDPNNVLGSIVPGSEQTSFNEVRINVSLFNDVIVNTQDESDTVTLGDLGASVLQGSVTVDGGNGFDEVLLANGASVGLVADANLLVDAETFKADLDSSVSVVGDGTIDITAAGGVGDFAGLNLRRASLSSVDGGITLTGVGGDTGNTNDGVILTHGSTVSTGGGSVTITGTATSTTGANDGISLLGGSDITAGGAGGITLTGTSSGVNSSYGVQLFSGTEVTTAGGDIAIVGSSDAVGSRNAGIYTNGATVTAGGAGSVAMTGTGGGAGSNNNGLSLAATAVDAGTSGDVTLVGMGGGGTSGNGGVQVGTRTSVSADGGDVTITGTGGAGTGVRNTGVSLLSGSSVSSGADTSITGVAGTGTSRNGGVSLVSSTVSAAGDLTVDGTGNGTGSYNSGISSSRSTLGGAEVTLAGTGSSSSTAGRFNDGVSISRGGVTASGTLTIDAAGGTGSRDNRGLMVNRAALGGTLAVTGSADTGSGARSTGVFIQNSVLSDDGTIEGTGGGVGGADGLGVYMRNITGGANLGVTTAPDTDEEKGGNYFDAVLPAMLVLGAGAGAGAGNRRKRNDLLSGLLSRLPRADTAAGEVEVYREEDGHVGLTPLVVSAEALVEAGIAVPEVATAEARQILLLTGGATEPETGLFAKVDAAGELMFAAPLKLVDGGVIGDLSETLDRASLPAWDALGEDRNRPVALDRTLSEAFGL